MVVGPLCVYSNNVKVFCISLEVRSIDELMMKYYCWRRKCKPAQIWEKVEKTQKSLGISKSALYRPGPYSIVMFGPGPRNFII